MIGRKLIVHLDPYCTDEEMQTLRRVVAGVAWVKQVEMGRESAKSELYCGHANELPSGRYCPCPPECICKQPGRTCDYRVEGFSGFEVLAPTGGYVPLETALEHPKVQAAIKRLIDRVSDPRGV